MKLTATAAKQATPKDKQYKMADGNGLYLLVTPKGQKYWRHKYRLPARRKRWLLAFILRSP